MPFEKGHARVGGRQRGSVNRVTVEIKDITAKLFDEDYFKRLKARLHSGDLAPAIEAKLLAYRYGEPRQGIDLDANIRTVTKVVHKYLSAAPSALPAAHDGG